MDESNRTTAAGLWTDATEFAVAAKVLISDGRKELLTPSYCLSAHAIELALKAFLLSKAVTLQELKKLGHDLEACLKRAKNLDLAESVSLAPKHEAVIRMLNSYYKAKEFEYRVTGFKEPPVLPDVLDCLDMLVEGVGEAVQAPRQFRNRYRSYRIDPSANTFR